MKARTLRFSLSTILSIVLAASMFGQPASFQQHGDNSSGTTVASENIDSITVGGTIRYVVEPDATANPAYNFATMSGTLASSFAWTVPAGIGTITGAPDTDNDITITAAGSAATGQITVVETSSAGCGSGTTTAIDVEVIGLPTADFSSTTDNLCTNDLTTVSYNLPVTLTTAEKNGNIRVIISMDGPATAAIYTNTFDIKENATTLNIPAGQFDDGYGDYVVTITEVSDRILRKSGLTSGTISTSQFTYTINRTPTTGVIYHLPNQ